MPFDIAPHIAPATTAVVALEVQRNLLDPELSMIPGIARHAEQIGLVDRLAGLYAEARRVGAQVVYISDDRRADGLGAPSNLMIARAVKGNQEWFVHGDVVDALKPEPADIVIGRALGMTGFFTTPLDAYLRNLGITTVILTGVSANIAVNGTSIEAMNLGYRVVVPGDGIAGDPPEYVEQLLRYTIRNLAIVTTVDQILAHWNSLTAGRDAGT
jgi:nicotinamidase-related amidase